MILKKKPLSFLTLIVIIVLSGYIFYLHTAKPKTGYVNIPELYNGFEMKKQMEQKYLKTKNARDKHLDSLKFELNALMRKIDIEKEKNPQTIKQFEIQREEFLQKEASFEEANTAVSKKYDQEILTQLNQYVKDFGTQNSYTLLFGSDGNGSLMFATEELNRTKDVLDFVNDKYNGIE